MAKKPAKTETPVIENASDATVETVAAAVESAIATTEVVAAVIAPVSKASLARVIWDAELAKQVETGVAMSRKAVVDRFVAETGLTLKGARTYFQNFRAKANMVVPRTPAAAPVSTNVEQAAA